MCLMAVAWGCAAGAWGIRPVGAQERPPTPSQTPRIDFPAVQERTLGNGLGVMVLESPAHPYVRLTMILRSGPSSDPVGKAGVAAMTADLLAQGTEGRTEAEIAEAIDFIGGAFGTSMRPDWTAVSVSALAESLPVAFTILADVVREPAFDPASVDASKSRLAQAAQLGASDPLQLAQRWLLRTLYPGHPYGVGFATAASYAGLSLDDVRRFHDEHYVASNAILVVTGSVSADDVFASAEATFGSWARGASPRPAYREPSAPSGRRVTVVHAPGQTQSYVMLGQLLPNAGDPAWADLEVGLRLLYLGRLFPILREQRGWSYQTFASAVSTSDRGYWRAGAVVPSEVTDSTVREVILQLESLRDEPVSQEEFESAVGSLVGGFPLTIDTPQEVVSQLVGNRLRGLDDAHLYSYRERIGAVTPSSLQGVMRRLVQPDDAAVIVVGDASQIHEGLRRFGDVRIVTPDGIPIDPSDLGGGSPRF